MSASRRHTPQFLTESYVTLNKTAAFPPRLGADLEGAGAQTGPEAEGRQRGDLTCEAALGSYSPDRGSGPAGRQPRGRWTCGSRSPAPGRTWTRRGGAKKTPRPLWPGPSPPDGCINDSPEADGLLGED